MKLKTEQIMTFFIVLLFIFKINAQQTDKNFPFHFSEYFDIPSESHLKYLDAENNKTLVTFYNKKSFEYSFLIYSPELKLENSKNINVKELFGKNIDFDKSYFLKLGHKIYFFYFNQQGKTGTLSVIEFSTLTLDFVGKSNAIIENAPIDFDFESQSSNNSKILFSYKFEPKGKKGEQRKTVGLIVLDEDFKKIQNQEFDLPFNPNSYYEFLLTNEGNIYSYYKVYDYDKGKVLMNDIPNYHFEAYSFLTGKKEYNTCKINLENYFLNPYTYPKMVLNTDNSLSVYFDCNKNDKSIDGIAYIKIDFKKLLYNLKDYYFEVPDEVFEEGKEKKEIASQEGSRFTDFHAYPLENGACDVVFVEVRTSGVNCYLFSGIYIMNFDKNNQLKMVKKIPLREISCSAFSASISWYSFVKNNELNVLYFNLAENLNLTPNKKMTRYENIGDSNDDGNLICATIDSKSNIATTIVAKLKDYKFCITASCFNIVGSKLIQDSITEKFKLAKNPRNQNLVIYSIDLK